jgi:hypothetical protein
MEIGIWKAAFFPFLLLPFAFRLDRQVKVTTAGPTYNLFLERAAKMQLGFGALISLGLFLS